MSYTSSLEIRENKLKEYKLSENAKRNASFIILDGIVCKDRWDFENGLDWPFKEPIDVTETNLIIGCNGHLMFTCGQQRVIEINSNNIAHRKRVCCE